MQTPEPRRGTFWQDMAVGAAIVSFLVRWEPIEDAEGDACGRLLVIESVVINGVAVKPDAFCESQIELWAMELESIAEDEERESHLSQQIDAYQQRVAA